MKRSTINNAIKSATTFFESNGWVLPHNAQWDVTDFGLGDFQDCGLVLVNLAEEEEYCEKLMYAQQNQVTPMHCHAQKKEDIIVRTGVMAIEIWKGVPGKNTSEIEVKITGEYQKIRSGDIVELKAGERVTLTPGLYHKFWPTTAECIIGEVSTANDDVNDNFFTNPDIGRYSEIEEDEQPLVSLLSDH
ncbi:D-lyxose/D-mannose family sugar isomerase [Persicobacter psychrovividus]|uniref:D-lyxose ketol-isomerase n=1 Tax=Persicobacter psychrovividus TaxID=387638 RepID=A0ABN6LDM6_9BACT|nr:hypothetical protein PEPS_35290 [Persicobacter psychrovividus]